MNFICKCLRLAGGNLNVDSIRQEHQIFLELAWLYSYAWAVWATDQPMVSRYIIACLDRMSC